jgi:hypothetical protein
MKLDTETLVKHRFWFLTGLSVIPVLIALFVLVGPVPGKIRGKREEITKEIKKVKGFSDPKRPEDVEYKKKEAEEHGKLKDVVWKAAWQKQEDLSTWPEDVEKKFNFKDGLFALKVQADRTKGAAAEPAAAEPAEKDKNAGPIGEFKGVIIPKGVSDQWIMVQGHEGKRTVTKRFERTKGAEVTVDDEKDKGKKVEFKGGLLPGDRVTITYQKGKYFGDELTPEELDAFKSSYKTQLPEILQSVNPVTAESTGVVQLKGWAYEDDPDKIPAGASFLVFHDGEWKANRFLSKEAWTAQEDVWIQRELYRLIAKANRLVSQFKADFKVPGTFRNPYWELKLSLTKDNKLTGTIKNLLHRRQKADVSFLVTVREGAEPEKISIGDLPPLNPLVEQAFKQAIPLQTKDATGIYAVEQVLTPETAAVRRIDVVAIGAGGASSAGASGGRPTLPAGGLPVPAGGKKGSSAPIGVPGGNAAGTAAKGGMAQSNRTFIKELKALHFPGDPKEEESSSEKEAPSSTPGPGLYDKQQMPPGGVGKSTPGGAAGGKGAPSVNGFVFERYLDLAKEARRVPVGLVLIVDQQHVGLVEAAFADSKLRFLTNQVLVNRYPYNVRLPETAVASADKTGGNPSGPALPPKGPKYPMFGSSGMMKPPTMPKMGSGPGFPGGSSSGRASYIPAAGYPMQGSFPGGSGPVGPGPEGPSASDEPEANIELVIYGVVTLYERYPPRPTPASGS